MATPIAVPTSSAALLDTAAGGPIRLMGWSVRKTTGACTIDLCVGGSGGQVIATINLAGSGNESTWFGDNGVICNSDILYALVGGTTTGLVGSIWVE
jgi:hypothetical protein